MKEDRLKRRQNLNQMSVPPAVCGAVGLYLFALSSDRRQERGYHIMVAMAVVLAGLIAVVMSATDTARYASLCLTLFGSGVPPPLTAAWLSGNTPTQGKRVLVMGVNGWGNVAGIIGAQLFTPEHAPEYHTPFRATLAFVAAALACVWAYRAVLQSVNRRRAAIRASKTSDEIDAERCNDVRYADRKWTFAYGL
jgi:peptidoglycan/LPS O-acetylase OafA/YrhL